MKKICFIAQFPPPMHGLSKAVETLYNSNLNFEIDSQGEFEFEKVDITNNKNFIKNLLKISRSKADLFYFTISQTKGGNLRDLVIFKLLELQHKKCLIHLHGGYYRQLVDNDMAGWQRKANYKAIGFCFHRSSIKYEKLSNKPVLTDNVLCRVAWGLLLISVVPTFYELYKDVTTVFFNGYSDTLGNATGIDKIFVLISGFYPSAILILYCFEEKRRRTVYFALGSYVLLQLLGGSRIAVFRLAIVLLVISNLYRKEISKKRAVMICIFGLVGVFVFSFVSSARNYIYLASNVQLFLKETATDLLENNFIFAAIKEMGNTQVINTLVYALCPKKVDYRYGMSFVRSIYSVLPNFLNLEYISIDEVFSPYYTVTNAGCGASFIAEGYWNFGYFSVLFFIALGYVWGTLSNRFKQLCNSKYVKPENFFVIVYLMYYMIFLVRSESIELGRSFVYYAVIPILISKLLKTKTVRGGGKTS